MKSGILAATVGALMFALTAQAVTVSGDVFLSGRTNHAGTKIMFRAASPSARTDSATSSSSGHYQQALQAGVYDVEFRHTGYTSYQRPGQILFVDTTLASATLLQGIFGSQSGMIGPGVYDVIDTLRVLSGQTWTIAAGTQLLFRPQKPLIVNGTLLATGTAGDSIVFAPRIEHWDSAWSGAQFLNASGLCRMDYCVIERAHGEVFIYSSISQSVGAIVCVNSSPTIEHCTVKDNQGADYGGGLYCSGGTPTIRDCEFIGNSANHGKAIALRGTFGVFERCRFIEQNGTGGELINCQSSASTRFFGCTMINNYYTVFSCRSSSPVIDSCLIDGYEALYISAGDPQISRCTIVGGIWLDGVSPVIQNSVLYDRGRWNPMLNFGTGTNAMITYSAIYTTDGYAFGGDEEYFPPAFGIIALMNANGDSCDTYYNIFLDPQFVNADSGDYHLTAGSPCIDAGDPALPRDPDGTVADMGAFYFDQLPVREDGHKILCPYTLAQNYPNPFNAQTRIAFDLPQPGNIALNVFDITGRLVATPLAGYVNAGAHDVIFDANDLPSGVYIYRLTAGDAADAKKMMVIK